MTYPLRSRARRSPAFSLIEILVSLSLIGIVISLVRFDVGGSLTIFGKKSLERLVDSEIERALFLSAISPESPTTQLRIPGCDKDITVYAGGHFKPAVITCGLTKFLISSSGKVVNESE